MGFLIIRNVPSHTDNVDIRKGVENEISKFSESTKKIVRYRAKLISWIFVAVSGRLGFESQHLHKTDEDSGGTPLYMNPKKSVLIRDIKAVRVESL